MKNTEDLVLPIQIVDEKMHGGFVKLIDFMGSDHRILEAARVSTGSAPIKGEIKDRGLIRYLMKNQHWSPFEQCKFTFMFKMPIFCARQFVRHRSWCINEYSLRYSEAIDEFYMPTVSEWRKQGTTNHQGSGELFDDNVGKKFSEYIYMNLTEDITDTYQWLLGEGVAREQARIILPLSQFTIFYATIDLRNLFHFLDLRLHEHTQQEFRIYAESVNDILHSLNEFTWSVEIADELRELNYTLLKMFGMKIEPAGITEYLKKSLEENKD